MNTNQENGMWGLSGSNVKSYGDLVSNWQGVKFYRELFDGSNPYFTCKDGVVTASREFKIEDHVNVGWSEATNCPAFGNETDAKNFSGNLKKLKLTCPLDPNKCTELIGIYKDQPSLLSTVVSPVCRDKIPLEQSVEEPAGFAWNDVTKAAAGVRAKDIIKFFNVTK
ncbi:hypothetical protein D3C87_1145220 [compost metagenome]